MQLRYTDERKAFYKELKSFKIVNAKSKWAKIEIKPTETYSQIPLTEMQKRLYGYAYRAFKKGVGFELTIDKFTELVNGVCVYCGNNAFSVDRIDSKIGYINGNVQPICKMCNIMKYTYSERQFISHVKRIAERFK